MEKFDAVKFTKKPSGDIAGYLRSRVIRENFSEEDLEKIKKGEMSFEERELSQEDAEQRADELLDLTLQKQELIQAGESNKKVSKNEKIDIGQDDFLEKLKNGEPVDFAKLNMSFSHEHSIVDSSMETEKETESVKERIRELAKNKSVLDAYENMMEGKIDIIKLTRQVEAMRKTIELKNLADAKLLAHRNNEDVKLTTADKKVLNTNKAINEILETRIEELLENEEIFQEAQKRELLSYRSQFKKGGIVETPSVRKEMGEILAHLELNIPVFLRGHLGAGKTEIALHVARKYYGVEPEFISGSEEATKYDIYGKTQIGTRDDSEKKEEYEMRVEEFKAMFPEATEEDIKKIEKEYYDVIVVKGGVTSFFQYGPLVRAMKEGKPVVIDEIDTIPHAILIRLNHILTRKPGDKVKIQENGGEDIEVAEGFCVIATGNIKSEKYDREELDAAFLSRWWSDEIKYLPQDETLQIIASSLMDKKGELEMDDENINKFEDVVYFTQAAEEIQKIFTGEKIDLKGEGADTRSGVGTNLEKSVLSMRDLLQVVKVWKAENFQKPLEDYIYKEFIKKATVQKDAIYLTQLFMRHKFFAGWKAEDFSITGLTDKKLNGFKGKKEKL